MKTARIAGIVAACVACLAAQQPQQNPDERRAAADALFARGMEAMKQGRYADAEDAFKKLREAERHTNRGVLGLSEVYMAENKPEDAMNLLLTEERAHALDLSLHVAVANLAVRTGKLDMALERYLSVLKAVAPGSEAAADLLLRTGETYRLKGDYENAAEYLQQARDAMPGNLAAAMTLAMTLDAAGRKGEAMAAYDAVIRINPKNAIALNNLAFLLADTAGDLDTALAYAKRAQEILPDVADIADTLGYIYLKKGDTGEAQRIFRKLVAKDPARAGYHYHLALALEPTDKAAAGAELEIALNSKPTPEEEKQIREAAARLRGK